MLIFAPNPLGDTASATTDVVEEITNTTIEAEDTNTTETNETEEDSVTGATVTETICTDTDGNTPTSKGYTYDGKDYTDENPRVDRCRNIDELEEFICNSDGHLDSEFVTCPNGCWDGICV